MDEKHLLHHCIVELPPVDQYVSSESQGYIIAVQRL